MSEFKDVVQWVKNETTGKSRTIKLGYAKEDKTGKMRLVLDALPVPRKNHFGDYTIELSLEEPYKRDQQQSGGGSGSSRRTSFDDGPGDDDVPF